MNNITYDPSKMSVGPRDMGYISNFNDFYNLVCFNRYGSEPLLPHLKVHPYTCSKMLHLPHHVQIDRTIYSSTYRKTEISGILSLPRGQLANL